MTLPGTIPPPPTTLECWGKGCFETIPEVGADGGDTKTAWDEAVRKGPEAIQTYLSRHNKVRHYAKCTYRDLPPSVHHWATSHGGDPHGRFEKALAELNEARRQD
jgi:hypothetical protein